MDTNLAVILAIGGSLVAGLVAVLAAARLGVSWGLVDHPDTRKVHNGAVPRSGGIGFALAATLVALPLLLLIDWPAGATTVGWITFAVAAVGMLAVGVLDDAVSLPGHYKLLALIAAGSALCGAHAGLDAVHLNPEQQATFPLGLWLSWPLTVLWVCGITVSIAFLDGLDGLAGGIAFIAAATIAIVAGLCGQVDVLIVAVCLCGALAGFLRYNGPWGSGGGGGGRGGPARVFMGDGGAMFLGFVLAGLPLMLNGREGVGTLRAMVLPVVVLSIPILDTALTLVRRKVLRRSLFAAEDGHVHHRLLAIGLSSQHAVLALWGATLAATTIGFLSLAGDGWASLGLLALLVPLWVGVFRTAGSVRGRETVAAIRRHRHSNRVSRRYRAAFEDAQLRLKKVGDFGEWWRETCSAAESLDFLSLELRTTRRDGEPYELNWQRPATKRASATVDATPEEALEAFDPADIRQAFDVTLDVPQRRVGKNAAPLKLAARVLVGHNRGITSDGKDTRATADLESASRRITWFSRLLVDHGLATLDDEDRVRWHKAHQRRLAWQPLGPNGGGHDGGDGLEAFPRPTFDRPAGEPRVAIVHDFLYVNGGAEKVLEQMLEVFPHADLFSVIDFIAPADRGFLKYKPATTTFIQKLPLARYKHRAYLPLMPLAIEQLDVSAYDVVLSSSYCVAKGVITRPDQLHICYCHSPVRFAWDLQGQYLAEAGIGPSRWPHKFAKNAVTRSILHYLRQWDARSANGVDVFLANSDFIGRRIEKAYRRESQTVYPPVDTSGFECFSEKQGYYFTSSRMVPYKKIALIAEAFTRTPERRLVVGGEGPDYEKIKHLAGPNVQLVGHQPREKFLHYMQRARAFVFAAEEDFGIVPVEAMACGTPVITYGRGGATETVIDGLTGVHFPEQTPESLLAAVDRFEQIETDDGWDPHAISRHAARFGVDRFRNELREVVLSNWQRRCNSTQPAPDARPLAATKPSRRKDEQTDAPSPRESLPEFDINLR